MSESANVRSIEAIQQFRAAVLRFQEELQICLTNIRQQLLRAQQWLDQDRPQYWRMEIQRGHTRVAEARGRLDACRRRRMGDFRPSCFEEQQALRREKRRLEIAHEKVEIVRRWAIQLRKEVDEFQGRSAPLERSLGREVPQLAALLDRYSLTLEGYAGITRKTPQPDGGSPSGSTAGIRPESASPPQPQDSNIEEPNDAESR